MNFLATSENSKQVYIFYLYNKKLIKSVIVNDDNIIKFSKDSKILYILELVMAISQFIKNFKLIYKDKVHSDIIYDLITINND